MPGQQPDKGNRLSDPVEVFVFTSAWLGLSAGAVFLMVSADRARARETALRTERLTAAMTFDLSQARRRYSKENGVTEEVAAYRERECRRFLGLIGVNRGVRFGLMSEVVDGYWHTMLECTELYRNYCQAVAGRFIDHDPDGGGQAPYARTWAAYRETFGAEPPADVWPRPTDEQIATAGVSRSDAGASAWVGPGMAAMVPALAFASLGQRRDDGGSSGGDATAGVDCGGHGCSGGCSGGGGGGCSGGCSGGCGGGGE